MAYKDDYWYVCGGYKLVVYPNNNYTGTPVFTMDNSATHDIYANAKTGIGISPNTGNSCKLYYNGNEISLLGLGYL
jgi:hypothetical protein